MRQILVDKILLLLFWGALIGVLFWGWWGFFERMYCFFFIWVHISLKQVNLQSTAVRVVFRATAFNAKDYIALNPGNQEAQLSGG